MPTNFVSTLLFDRTWNSAQVGMSPVESIGGGIVESEDDVTLDTIGVVDEEVGDGSTVGDEICTNTFGGNS